LALSRKGSDRLFSGELSPTPHNKGDYGVIRAEGDFSNATSYVIL
jgi:hypothetical protein